MRETATVDAANARLEQLPGSSVDKQDGGLAMARRTIALILTSLVLGLGMNCAVAAVLENPPPNSFQSGLGLISGWKCEAESIEIEFDGGNRLDAAYGTSRADTQSVCNDEDNGYGLLINYNDLGSGRHTIRVFADGEEFASATVTVTTFGPTFLTNVSGNFLLHAFPQIGSSVRVQWQQASQNFTITEVQQQQLGAVTGDLGGVIISDALIVRRRSDNRCALRVTIENTTNRTKSIQVVYHAFNFQGNGVATAVITDLFPPKSKPLLIERAWRSPDDDLIMCASLESFRLEPSLTFIIF